MKKIMISLVVAMAMTVSCKQTNDVVLSGTIDNASGEKIILEQMGLQKTIIVDSTIIGSDGTFKLTSPIVAEPTFYKATLSGNKTITFIADSLEHIIISADAKSKNWLQEIKFENSEESSRLQYFIAKAQQMQSYIIENRNNTSLNEAERVEVGDSIASMLKTYKAELQQNIFNSPRSMVNYYVLYQNILDIPIFDVMNPDDQMMFNAVATSLNLAYPNSERVNVLCNDVLQARTIQKKIKQNEELLKNAKEVRSPDLSMPDKNGEKQVLSSLRGKTVILQFWTSYDKNSRQCNTQLQKLYKKYHERGLEIYQVSFDTSKILWEDAMQKDELTWINVCDLQGQNSTAAAIYNVTSIPANYIIAPDGELIGKDLFGTRLDNKLADIFK